MCDALSPSGFFVGLVVGLVFLGLVVLGLVVLGFVVLGFVVVVVLGLAGHTAEIRGSSFRTKYVASGSVVGQPFLQSRSPTTSKFFFSRIMLDVSNHTSPAVALHTN